MIAHFVTLAKNISPGALSKGTEIAPYSTAETLTNHFRESVLIAIQIQNSNLME